MAHDTLQRLYKAEPKAKGAVEGAAGYAVFSNTGLKILMLGSGKGEGLAVNNKSHQETFMKVVELQAGLGFGVKKFSVIFVFENDKAFDSFVNSGWEFGGQSTVAATTGDKGGAMIPECDSERSLMSSWANCVRRFSYSFGTLERLGYP